MSDPKFWDDQTSSQRSITQLKDLKDKYQSWEELSKRIKDAEELISLAQEDNSLQKEVEQEISKLESKLGNFELKVFLSDK